MIFEVSSASSPRETLSYLTKEICLQLLREKNRRICFYFLCLFDDTEKYEKCFLTSVFDI